uniref:Uncharacterized protein n=1 Tax=Candidatus Kentrum sp. DK TaxID=2126562 RepID=A0A450TF14_9GAMM|nr:MAG: hypothetical protein BECKDK2373B_GA0170837_11537 [Candidatus Kentron sp. DK]
MTIPVFSLITGKRVIEVLSGQWRIGHKQVNRLHQAFIEHLAMPT